MAELLVRANPLVATPTSPLGEVITVKPDGFTWGASEVREFLILVVPLTEQEATTTYLAHNDAPDGNPTQITKFNPADIPPAHQQRIVDYYNRLEAEKGNIDAAARPSLVATCAQKLGRPLDPSETALDNAALIAKFKREPWIGDATKAFGLSSRTHREGATSDIPIPAKINLSQGQVNRFTHTVPYPVT